MIAHGAGGDPRFGSLLCTLATRPRGKLVMGLAAAGADCFRDLTMLHAGSSLDPRHPVDHQPRRRGACLGYRSRNQEALSVAGHGESHERIGDTSFKQRLGVARLEGRASPHLAACSTGAPASASSISTSASAM